MGATALLEFIGGAPRPVRGFGAALLVELKEGAWRSQKEVAAAFPLANWESDRIVIPIDEQSFCVVAFNFRTGIALIESIGPMPPNAAPPISRRRPRS